MAKIVASTLYNAVFMGEDGNSSVDYGSQLLAAAQIADTIDLQSIKAGQKLFDVALIAAALGAGSTISLGWRYADGTAGGSATALLAATSTAAAGKTRSVFAPIYFAKDAILYATVGGGAATGQIDTVSQYENKGVL